MTTTSSPEVVVIGGGVMGAAAAWALARAGREALLLERFEIGHRRGSSHGRSRIFRLSYDDARYVRMAQHARTLWREAEAESGQELLRITGGLDLGAGAESHAETLATCGVPFEHLDASEVMRRFPGVAVPAGTPTLHQADAGIVLADRAVATFTDLARRGGAEIRQGLRVTAITPGDAGVDISTQEGTLSARVVVVAAGAWARELLATAGIDLPVRPTRETVAYFRAEGTVPSVVEWSAPAVYGLVDPVHGLKAGVHHAGRDTDPDRDEGPDLRSVELLSAWVRERFPAADPDPVASETCLYTNTTDESFVIERRGPVVIGSACSGHGFKFAPAIGSRLAELALGGG
jgi:sarcosine oxidase